MLSITPEGIEAHEARGCPDPDACVCEGQFPFLPKWGLIVDHETGDVRKATEEDLDRACEADGRG